MLLLAEYRDEVSGDGPEIRAVTFQDFDSEHSDSLEIAAGLAERAEVAHQVVEAELIEETFGLTRPIAQILMLLMETNDAHRAMYVDHHTTRRALEVAADDLGSSQLALGLHATDLIGGLLNAWSTGHEIGPVPDRPVGGYRYVFPLAFVSKRQLHLY